MNSETAALFSFHLGEIVNCDQPRAIALNRWPALLRRYDNLTSVRHDYPLILIGNDSGPGIESLAAVVNNLLQRVAPKGPSGERLRRHILRLEQEIRTLVYRKETECLSRLWSMAAENQVSEANLSEDDKRRLRESFDTGRSALEIDGDVIGCGADTADRVMRHLWLRSQTLYKDRIAAELRKLAIRLNDLLRSDELEADKARQPQSLRRTFGSQFGELIDFDVLSDTLRCRRSHEPMPEKRRKRIESALRVLHEEKFFGVAPDIDRYNFAFTSCTEALAAFKCRLSGMADVIRAIRVAALELNNGYRDEFHDDFFGHFAPSSLTAEDIRWFPSYFVSIRDQDCNSVDRAHLIEILSSDLPFKLIFQLDHLFQSDDGRPDFLRTSAWKTQLATMASNLGSDFVLQTTTSNLCSLTESLVKGLNTPGVALFSIFSPGEDSYPGLHPYLAAAAAVESRLFPVIVFDPGKGDTGNDCFSLRSNPQRQNAWPVHSFTYEDESMQAVTESLPFTPLDFLAADPVFSSMFRPVQRRQWSQEMVPLAEYLQGDGKMNNGRLPFVLVIGPDDKLNRLIVNSAAVELTQRVGRHWHSLQELAGINKSHASPGLDTDDQACASEKPKSAEEFHGQPPAKSDPSDAPTAVAARANGKVEQANSAPGEPWIETPRCTSCNACTNRNSRMFKYNENKQAYIADLHAGTYRDLVEAAEACKVAIIHPGEPWDSNEPDLEALLERAKVFR
jgi:ferredoxin